MPLHKVLTLSLLTMLIVIMNTYRIRHVNDKPLWDDAFTYLRVAREIRKHGRMPTFLDFYFAGDERGQPFTLPPLLMVLLSPFAQLSYSTLIHASFVLDILIALSIALASQWLMGCDVWQSLCASMLYLLTPINARTSAFLTPRPLALLCFSWFLICICEYFQNPSVLFFVLASLSAALLFLAQRMVAQIVLIITPLLVVCSRLVSRLDLTPLLDTACAGLLLTFLLTGGAYRDMLIDHVRRIALHARHGDQTFFRRKLGNPLQIIKANPWTMLVVPVLWNRVSWETGFVVLAAYLGGILFLSEFWVFGNGVNHMFFTAPLVALIISSQLLTGAWIDLAVVVTGVGCFLIVMREYSVVRAKAIDGSWFQCFEYINREQLSGRILVLPRVACPPLIHYTGLTIVSGGHGSDAMSFNRLFLQKSLSELAVVAQFVAHHQVEYLLIETDRFPMEDLVASLRALGSTTSRMFAASTLCLVKVQ